MSYSVGILGCGVMGQSFLSAVQKHRVLGTAEDKAKLPTKFYTTNHSESSIDNLKKILEENVKKISEESLDNYGFDDHECYTGKDNLTLIEKSDVILISIKPYQMEQVLTQVKESGLELKNKVFISLVAGWTTASMREILGDDEMIITRLMTNTPAKFGEGAVVVSHTGKEEYLQKWKANMNFMIEQLGVMCELPESKMDAATALVGSGPAFVLNFLEAMVDAGIKMGIPYKESYILALKTVEGTAKMGQLTNYTHPSVLKHQVCTPGGTTIAGLVEMDNRGVKSGVINGITEAARVASELGKKK